MKAATFKTEIKAISTQLKGITLQVVKKYSTKPYNSLAAFGAEVLEIEKAGLDIAVTQVWTSAGAVKVNSFTEFVSLLNLGNVTGAQFTAEYVAKDFADYLKTSFGTND